MELAVARTQVTLDTAIVKPMPIPSRMLLGNADRFIHCGIPLLSQPHAIWLRYSATALCLRPEVIG